VSNLPDRFAWCFSHGFMHPFDPEAPWCTASWVWLNGDHKQDAEADKRARFGDAQFLHELPDGQQLTLIHYAADHTNPKETP
jgi:hypothetical protein